MIGRRLKLARAAAGLSLRALAGAISHRVTAQAIGKYERDEAMPGSAVLIALADALHTTVDYLLGDPELVLHDLEFRKNTFTSKRDEAQVEATVLSHLERYLAIEDILHLPSARWDAPRDAPYPVLRDVVEADRAADALRRHWGFGYEPIPNLVELLEGRGIKIFACSLGSVGGLAARAGDPGHAPVPFIVVNADDWGERQRFTIGHELGHIALDISRRLDAERVAHRFSGAFLMPADAMWLEVGKHRSAIALGELLALKRLFGVSIQALTHRCRDLGIISQATYQRLFDEFARLGWRSPPYEEYGAFSGEQPNRFNRLCLRALAEGAISESKAAELLNIGIADVDLYMQATPPPLTATG
ncbi:MAG: XRE family transcriptional regulator [Gammaproteobacteria bacterium]|nr:XRE family transcriptional regulator [Gammaproteobacteria bacterium]